MYTKTIPAVYGIGLHAITRTIFYITLSLDTTTFHDEHI